MTFAACESTESESAKIEREAAIAREHEPGALKLGAPNRSVRVSRTTLLSSGGRGAVAVRLSSSSAHAQTKVPVLIEVKGKAGRVLYSNQPGGTDPKLQRISLLRPHASAWWVNDQVLVNQPSAGVTVRVGTGAGPSSRNASAAPAAKTTHVVAHPGASTVSGELVNEGSRTEREVPVFAVALRGGKVVGAGRALVPKLAGRRGASARFQIALVGDATKAKIELTAVPSES